MILSKYKKNIIIFIFISIFFIILYITINIYNSKYTIRASESKKYIAFTYDDGPSEYTPLLIDLLEKNNSSATFFMIGNKMEAKKEIVLKVHNSNSEIGSHTYSHKNLTKLNSTDLNYELEKCDEIFYEITSSHLKYLRPPYDFYEKSIIKSNYYIVTWNIDPKDWLNKDADKIYNAVIEKACDGCIVIMHDIYEESYEASVKLINTLKKLGYSVVSVSKLIKEKEYNLQKNNIISSIH